MNVGAAVVVHLEGGGAWFFGCRLDLLIEHACLRVLAVVELVVTWEACSFCREVCKCRNLGDAALGDVLVVRRAVACVAGWTGSANDSIYSAGWPATYLQSGRRAREISNVLMMLTGNEQSVLLMMVAGMT